MQILAYGHPSIADVLLFMYIFVSVTWLVSETLISSIELKTKRITLAEGHLNHLRRLIDLGYPNVISV